VVDIKGMADHIQVAETCYRKVVASCSKAKACNGCIAEAAITSMASVVVAVFAFAVEVAYIAFAVEAAYIALVTGAAFALVTDTAFALVTEAAFAFASMAASSVGVGFVAKPTDAAVVLGQPCSTCCLLVQIASTFFPFPQTNR
jgi:hypothetical protein